jgi:hypothetical protein
MARAGRRLHDALQPADDVEETTLQMLVQTIRVEHVEALAAMAERRYPPRLRPVS